MEGLVFGWRTAVLALAGAQIALLAVAIARAGGAANRLLAALLAVIVGLLTPFAIGFAGFYDKWPWLTFAPFAVPLALGPLVFAYVHAIVLGRSPARLWLHLTPGLVQFCYQAICFCLPMAAKEVWDGRVHAPFLDPVVNLAIVVGLVAYSVMALRLLRVYRAWLTANRSDDDRFAARWLTRALAAVLATVAVWLGYQAFDAFVVRLDYFGVLGLYLVLALFGSYLGIEGWRHAALAFPPITEPAPASEPAPETAAGRDWRALGEQWATRTREAGWAAEPDLTLAGLARRLGVNSQYLSRALNEGLGLGFSAFVNGLRAEAVAAALAEGARDDLLQIAFEAGFSSKASFNRAFLAAYGLTPSAYRARVSDPEFVAPSPVLRRAGG